MGELDFRKKRKNTNIRGTARKQGKNSRQRELRFENEKREKRSSGKRWGKNKKNTKGIVLWAVELLLVCMTAVFLVAAFGQRVNVIGDSMSPVLKNGNVVMINHFIYNIKDPSRGDIAAFQKDGDGADQRRKTAYRRKTAESRVCVGYRICGNSVRTGPSGKR